MVRQFSKRKTRGKGVGGGGGGGRGEGGWGEWEVRSKRRRGEWFAGEKLTPTEHLKSTPQQVIGNGLVSLSHISQNKLSSVAMWCWTGFKTANSSESHSWREQHQAHLKCESVCRLLFQLSWSSVSAVLKSHSWISNTGTVIPSTPHPPQELPLRIPPPPPT